VEYHVAQYDETLWSIGQKYGMKKDAIKRKNRMSKTETLLPGRVLYLKSIRPEEVKVEYKKVDVPASQVNEVLQSTENKKEEIVPEKESIKVDVQEQPLIDTTDGVTVHYIQKNETLYSISRLYHVTVDDIKECNDMESDLLPASLKYLKICDAKRVDDIVERRKVNSEGVYEIDEEIDSTSAVDTSVVKKPNKFEHHTLILRSPKPDETTESQDTSKNNKATENESTSEETVTDTTKYIKVLLEPGTTLYGLSKRYGVPMRDILAVNQLTDLQAGDTIRIPTSAEKFAEYEKEQLEIKKNENEIKFYTVKAGDTMYGVSKKLAMTIEDLKKLNNKKTDILGVGEVLKYK